MQTYKIHESNLERLVKKLTRIQNKCRKYGCDFHFAEVGEEFETVKDENGNEFLTRFVLVEAEGVAIVNGWRFVASLEHTEKGNLINRACDIEVPERYYTCPPDCEHCHVIRGRKSSFIVMNTETGEFKQVGRNCLCDYTHGMSADGVAQYVSAHDSLIEGETPEGGWSGASRFVDTREWLCYVAETVRHFGYVKHDPESTERSTRTRAGEYYGIDHGAYKSWYAADLRRQLEREMDAVGFSADSKEAHDTVEAALAWLDEQTESSNYMHNLKTACALECIDYKHFGITASLIPVYRREMEREEKRKAERQQGAASSWVGEVGKRVEVKVAGIVCVTGWETQWGYTKVYKITGEDGNIYTWKTSNWVDEDEVKSIKGTVKAHNDFRGTKQTELTRCKCIA